MKPASIISISCLLACLLGCIADTRVKQYGSGGDFDLKIAYNVFYDEAIGNYEVFTMNPDGSNKKNVSNWKGVDWVYHTFDNKIYFVSDRDTNYSWYYLYEMDVDGNNVRKVTPFPVVDSWISSRKNGREILLTAKREGKRGFYLIDRNGNTLQKVFVSDGYINDPMFSPNGKELVYRSRDTGIDELWIMKDNGTYLRQLTHYPEDDSVAKRHHYHAGPPFWEPNQNIISYLSNQNGTYNIYTIKPDGSDNKMLLGGDFNYGWHSWSPDGKQIVYDGTPLDSNNYDIYIMNADGSGKKQLTTDANFEQAPLFVNAF